MKHYLSAIIVLISTTIHAQKMKSKMNEIKPPVAKIVPKKLEKHGYKVSFSINTGDVVAEKNGRKYMGESINALIKRIFN